MADIANLLKALCSTVYIVESRADAQGIDSRLVAHTDTKSHVAEQYRALQTHLYALASQKNIRTVAFTSSLPQEGKTLTCCNIALTIASDHTKRVVLVDCDLRKPEIHSILNIKKSPGLSDIINGKHSIADVTAKPAVGNLFVIPSGTSVSNPSELLRQSGVRDFFEKLKASFDYIIIDTPPVMPVSDSRIVGAICDALIVVARSEKTTTKTIKEMSWLLETARIKPLACVLTGCQTPFDRYEGYYTPHTNGPGKTDTPST